MKTIKIKEGQHAGKRGVVMGWRGNGMVDIMLVTSDPKVKTLVSERRSNIEDENL